MSRNRSLRGRLLAGFTVLGAALLFTGAAFWVMTYLAGQESILQRMLLAEVNAFLAERRTHPDAAPPRTAVVTSHIGEAALPPLVRENLHRFEPEDDEGVEAWEWREIQMWRGDVPGLDGRLYILAGHPATPGAEVLMPNVTRGLLVLLCGIGLALLWLARLLSLRLARPLRRLAAEVEGFDPVAGEPPAPGPDTPAELLPVLGALGLMRRRLDEFVLRERGFTRDASHELRTPLAVVQGAATLLRRQLGDRPDAPALPLLARIEQAVEDMTATVTACLWLAREQEAPLRLARAPAADLLRRLVETHRPLLGDRPVTVDLRTSVEFLASFPLEGLRLVASNLIRNAFLYTASGSVEVALDAGGLEVRDSGPGLPPDLQDALNDGRPAGGIGLRLCVEACRRLDWKLACAPAHPRPGTRIRVGWPVAPLSPTDDA